MSQAADAHAELIHIGMMAERVGLSLRTVRYYEEIGLVKPSSRTKGGFRLYGPEQEETLRVLKAMKPLGFSLDEMREFIDLLDDAARSGIGRRESKELLERISVLQQEIHVRRVNLLHHVEATSQISAALDAVARHLS